MTDKEKEARMQLKTKLIGRAPIVYFYGDFIVLAQNKADFDSKCSKISRGDTRGFYYVLDFIDKYQL